jgi:hypothetical protein
MPGRWRGLDPECDEHYVGLEHDPFAAYLLDLHAPVGKEARMPADLLDAVAHQVPFDGPGHELRDLELSGHEQAPGIPRARGRDQPARALPEPGEVDGSLAKGLGRDPGGAYRDPARPGVGIDDGDALSEVGRLGRSLLAGRARADHDQVVLRHHAPAGLTRAGPRSCRIAAARPVP